MPAEKLEKSFKETYDHFFNSGDSLSKIRDAALTDRLFPSYDDIEVPGRSLAWKLFLIPDEPLTTSPIHPETLLTSLRSSRKRYADELSEKMRAPDGSYGEGFIPPDPSYATKRETEKATNLEKNNPLSLHTDNPWTEWFAAVELRKTIFQDVERTFPEIEFFRQPEVQDQLTNILFLYSTTHLATGYRQGMHELLAPVYFALDLDSTIGQCLEDPAGGEICSKPWVAADAWVIFECIMKSVSTWYEWREAPEKSSNLPSPLSHHVNLNVQSGPVEIKPYVTPIVRACNRVQSVILKSVDPVLWKHIQSTGIEPQIYGIRWLRLLFTREFSLPDALKLWDGLFACDPTFELAPWICVAMLIRIRNELIPADYTGQLTVLLKYPVPPASNEAAGHHTSLLLRQALALQMSPNPSTGSSLVTENRNFLGIPIEVPEPAPAPPRRQPAQTISERSLPRRSGEHARQASNTHLGFPEMFARGIAERGESFGINKSLMSAVSELRRNIPELAASFIRSPTTTSVFPLTDESSLAERPPWEPKSRLQIEREIGQIQSTNKLLGQSLTWVVDALLQDESRATNLTQLKRRKQEALEALSYVRDVLNGSVNDVDQERLFSDEENAKRRLRSTHIQSEPSPRTTPTSQGYFDRQIHAPREPVPVPVVDSSSKAGLQKPRSPATSQMAAQRSQYPTSPSPSSPLEVNTGGGLRLAPWNYTQSGFSGNPSSLPSTSLPRLPPRISSGIHRQGQAAIVTPAPKASVRVDKPETQRTPDPLGVLS
ncbi:hypothetical protein E1B28_008682 [Marasmius oreades]|uniref:Rab-GAP TBC domain-containing protein n=1 Tax=Marasmius oreades TaxID=181124 RepID=A0A9P7RYW3_9AGAR|nr:uncharacterized protein E1B28_008682 [Marasmius oreades]KAG7092321.1 hypothetical protein E1B28_008682 [Marasmius oreades]